MGFFSRVAQAVFNTVPAPRAPAQYYRAPRDTNRWPQWLSSGLTITRMSAILRQADQGYLVDYFQLIQEIAAREALITGLLSVRCAALSQRPVVFTPATGRYVDKALAAEVAQCAQEIYDGLRLSRVVNGQPELYGGGKTLVEQLVLASYYGVRVGWINWSVPTGSPRPRPTSIELLDERRLWHDIQTNALYLATAQDPSRGLNLSDIDPAHCVVARYPRISQQLAMAGAARAILLPWWIRFGSYKDFATYLETWSKPSLLATSSGDVSASYDEETLSTVENLLEDWMGDTRSILPENFKIEVIEAVKGGEEVFNAADKMTERHLQFALVGQVGAIAGDITTHASGAQAQHVRDDLTDGDAVFVGEILERIVGHGLAVEFGPGYPMPRCTFAAEQSVEALKAEALMWSSAIYPINSAVKAGIPVNIPAAFAKFRIPLSPDGKLDPQWLANLAAVSRVSTGGTPGTPAPDGGGGASTPPTGDLPPTDRPTNTPETQASPFGRGLPIRVGDRVTVKAGAAHDEMTRGKTGVVQEISTAALAIQFEGMPLHKWYTEAELDRAPAPERQASMFERDHAGLMIALYPSPEVQAALALDGGEPADEIHLTLAYLGDAASYPYVEKLTAILSQWAKEQPSMSGEVQGLGIWGKPGEYVLWASPDVNGLAAARYELMRRLTEAGCIGKQDHDFTPHLTLSYTEKLPALPELPPLPLHFDQVWLVQAGQRTAYRFAL